MPIPRAAGAVSALALGLALSGPAAASDCTPPSPGLVAELLGWIGEATGYDVSAALADPPTIRFCAEGDAIPYPGEATLITPGQRGLYDYDMRRIHLVAPWRADRPRDVAVLLHELVHDVQFLNRPWECPNATEWEAYKLYDRWLAERGIDTAIDWVQVYFWSRCNRNPHP